MKIKEFIRRSSILTLAFSQLLLFPVYSSSQVRAQEVTPETTTTETIPQDTPPVTDPAPVDPTPAPAPAPAPVPPPAPPKAGPRPSGADSNLFIYDYSTDTWESFLYSYEPITRVRTLKDVPTVRYNFDTKLWEKLGWTFSAPKQAYEPYVISTSTTQPAGKTMGVTPQMLSNAGLGGTSIQGTGPNSSTNVSNSTNNNTGINLNNNTDFNIVLNLLAQTGNASVLGNTTGGNAKTGNADSTANVLNQIQSNWDIGNLLTFSSDLYGDIYGDLLVNTSNIGPNSNVAVDNTKNNNLDINVNNDTQINNDIHVAAQSGDAKVKGNTTGGDATSGDANALVNIINMINSSINSGANFMGTLNIYGNLDGDILFPKGALETLIAGTGANSNVGVSNSTANNLDANINNNTAISNNVSANATTGDALVANNTKGGDATSGNATSSVTMLNLTGKDVVSENTLLVFINVLGKWVGVLMDAPAGTTAAAIGGGAVVNSNTDINNNVTYNENNNAAITNNVIADARSGDASVVGNTTGGNATTGDANATVNIANLVGSNITTNSWFGVLFINVFGTWSGSFGLDTEAGDHQDSGGSTSGVGGQGGEGPSQASQGSSGAVAGANSVRVFGFESTGDGGHRAVALAGGQGGDVAGQSVGSDPFVLGASTGAVEGSALEQTGDNHALFNMPVGITLVLVSAGLVFGNRFVFFLARRKK